ncbi:hypothetical protein AN216_06280 [Streptomyces oceani]|uniref:Uncharacterized protein n=1 Tax=Streptomyces oceani TaxID=1075402 RepID=A0A1E7KKW0_9ACTN|nr:hypothetical protein AN216_06280 [Streptomyces oceani]
MPVDAQERRVRRRPWHGRSDRGTGHTSSTAATGTDHRVRDHGLDGGGAFESYVQSCCIAFS